MSTQRGPPSKQVLVWGLGKHGVLGSGTSSKTRTQPTVFRSLPSGTNLMNVATGWGHCVATTDTGKVYTWGWGAHGQLGQQQSTPSTPQPGLVTGLDNERVVHAAAGWRHTALVTDDGRLYLWGWGIDGRLGHGDRANITRPKQVDALKDVTVSQISLGDHHSAALTSRGDVYTWGWGKHGILGHGSDDHVLSPTLVDGLQGIQVKQVAVGWAHTAALTTDGKMYTWGWDLNGQLGLGSIQSNLDDSVASVASSVPGTPSRESKNTTTPELVRALAGETIVHVACGSYHTVAVTDNGQVYSWGWGKDGRLGHGDEVSQSLPRLVEGLKDHFIVHVECGDTHSAALSVNGKVFVWGSNEDGQLGLGETEQPFFAQPVALEVLDEVRVRSLHCGGFYTLAVADGHQTIASGTDVVDNPPSYTPTKQSRTTPLAKSPPVVIPTEATPPPRSTRARAGVGTSETPRRHVVSSPHTMQATTPNTMATTTPVARASPAIEARGNPATPIVEELGRVQQQAIDARRERDELHVRLRKDRAAFEKELRAMEHRLQDSEHQQLIGRDREVLHLRDSLNRAERQIADYEDKLAAVEANRGQERGEELERVRAQLADTERELESREREVSSWKEQHTTAMGLVRELESELAKASKGVGEADELQRDLDAMEVDRARLVSSLDAAQSELRTLRASSVAHASASRAASENAVEILRGELDSSRARADDLNAVLEEVKSERDSAMILMNRYFSDFCGSMASLIEETCSVKLNVHVAADESHNKDTYRLGQLEDHLSKQVSADRNGFAISRRLYRDVQNALSGNYNPHGVSKADFSRLIAENNALRKQMSDTPRSEPPSTPKQHNLSGSVVASPAAPPTTGRSKRSVTIKPSLSSTEWANLGSPVSRERLVAPDTDELLARIRDDALQIKSLRGENNVLRRELESFRQSDDLEDLNASNASSVNRSITLRDKVALLESDLARISDLERESRRLVRDFARANPPSEIDGASDNYNELASRLKLEEKLWEEAEAEVRKLRAENAQLKQQAKAQQSLSIGSPIPLSQSIDDVDFESLFTFVKDDKCGQCEQVRTMCQSLHRQHQRDVDAIAGLQRAVRNAESSRDSIATRLEHAMASHSNLVKTSTPSHEVETLRRVIRDLEEQRDRDVADCKDRVDQERDRCTYLVQDKEMVLERTERVLAYQSRKIRELEQRAGIQSRDHDDRDEFEWGGRYRDEDDHRDSQQPRSRRGSAQDGYIDYDRDRAAPPSARRRRSSYDDRGSMDELPHDIARLRESMLAELDSTIVAQDRASEAKQEATENVQTFGTTFRQMQARINDLEFELGLLRSEARERARDDGYPQSAGTPGAVPRTPTGARAEPGSVGTREYAKRLYTELTQVREELKQAKADRDRYLRELTSYQDSSNKDLDGVIAERDRIYTLSKDILADLARERRELLDDLTALAKAVRERRVESEDVIDELIRCVDEAEQVQFTAIHELRNTLGHNHDHRDAITKELRELDDEARDETATVRSIYRLARSSLQKAEAEVFANATKIALLEQELADLRENLVKATSANSRHAETMRNALLDARDERLRMLRDNDRLQQTTRYESDVTARPRSPVPEPRTPPIVPRRVDYDAIKTV